MANGGVNPLVKCMIANTVLCTYAMLTAVSGHRADVDTKCRAVIKDQKTTKGGLEYSSARGMDWGRCVAFLFFKLRL